MTEIGSAKSAEELVSLLRPEHRDLLRRAAVHLREDLLYLSEKQRRSLVVALGAKLVHELFCSHVAAIGLIGALSIQQSRHQTKRAIAAKAMARRLSTVKRMYKK